MVTCRFSRRSTHCTAYYHYPVEPETMFTAIPFWGDKKSGNDWFWSFITIWITHTHTHIQITKLLSVCPQKCSCDPENRQAKTNNEETKYKRTTIELLQVVTILYASLEAVRNHLLREKPFLAGQWNEMESLFIYFILYIWIL